MVDVLQNTGEMRKRSFASTVDIKVCTPSSKRSKVTRAVSFSKETKTFDGLSPASRLVDSVVWDFFMSQTVNSSTDIVKIFVHLSDSRTCLYEVCTLLDDLCQRLNEYGNALVLPGGGGTGAKLQEVHSPALHELCEISWQAYDELNDGSEDIAVNSSECMSPQSSEVDDASSEDGRNSDTL